ncbi:DUF1294 domain-containing protein [Vibrio sp. S4M6]|uniref:DUF1294 domain-containing protein n=1 Tax=Vibrio sinus TaxID=2946865 RepID=UPI00202A3C99|nr:DUF1294 domain-containing protein [Vibrio sinus]MCL9780592.1 DUF1294 domain-containing protein [Vibrio sinus]
MKAIKGKIVELSQEKGFGYIVPTTGRLRVRFKFDDYIESKKSIAVGEEVLFRIVKDESGQGKAIDIQRVRHCRLSLVAAIWFALAMVGCVLYFQYPIEVLVYYSVINVLVWLVCWLDKRASVAGRPVTGESALLFLSLIGGWVAGAIAPYFFKSAPRSALYKMFFVLVIAMQFSFFTWSLSPKGESWVNQKITHIYQTQGAVFSKR